MSVIVILDKLEFTPYLSGMDEQQQRLLIANRIQDVMAIQLGDDLSKQLMMATGLFEIDPKKKRLIDIKLFPYVHHLKQFIALSAKELTSIEFKADSIYLHFH